MQFCLIVGGGLLQALHPLHATLAVVLVRVSAHIESHPSLSQVRTDSQLTSMALKNSGWSVLHAMPLNCIDQPALKGFYQGLSGMKLKLKVLSQKRMREL